MRMFVLLAVAVVLVAGLLFLLDRALTTVLPAIQQAHEGPRRVA